MEAINSKGLVYKKYGPVYILPRRYMNGRLALTIHGADDGDYVGERIAVITVNIPQFPLNAGEILVKSWSENEGMARWLDENGIAVDTGGRAPSGHVEAHVMQLLWTHLEEEAPKLEWED